MTETVSLIEVSPRDGLQNEPTLVSTAGKIELISLLVEAGARRIEAVSFARSDLVPQMADAESVMAGVPRDLGVSYIGLVLNEKGALRAIGSGVDEINVVLPVTDEFAAANQNTTVEKALVALGTIGRHASAARIPVTVTFAVAFGCPFAGAVSEEAVLSAAREAVSRAELAEIALADTIGCATPWQVGSLFEALRAMTPLPLRAHFHETRHTALANAYAALDVGVRRFDASVGGLGGCPFAPGAAGNVSTEDLAWFMREAGYLHSVDIDRAIAAGRWITTLLGVDPRTGVGVAGPFPPSREVGG